MAFWGKSFGEIGSLFKSSFGNAFADVNSKFDTAISNTERLKANMAGIGQGLKGVFTTPKDSPLELMLKDEAESKITKFAEATQSGAVGLQKFNNELKDKGMKAYLSQVDAGKASFEGYTKYVNATNMALQKTTLASKAATLGMKALSLVGNMAIGVGIGLAINGLITGLDYLIHYQDKLVEKANKLSEEYKQLQSDVSGLQEQLNANRDKINEINKNPLDIVGANTLKTLQLENAELERQLALTKQLADGKKAETGEAAYKALTNEIGYGSIYQYDEMYQVGTIGESAQYSIDRIKALNKELGELDVTDKRYAERKSSLGVLIEEENKILRENITTIGDLKAQLDLNDESQKELYDSLTQIQNAYHGLKTLSPGLNTFDEIFKSEATEEQKRKLFELAQQGKLTAEEFEKNYPMLNVLFKAIGLSVDDVITKITDLAKVQNNVDFKNISKTSSEVIKSFSEVEKKINTISGAIKDFSDNGKLLPSTLSELGASFGGLSSFNEFLHTMSDSSSSVDDVTNSLTNLAVEYLSTSDALENLDGSTKKLVISMLESIGVTNAEEVATGALVQAQTTLAAQKILAANPDFLNMSTWETQSLFLECGASESAAKMVNYLALQKALASDPSMSNVTAEEAGRLIGLAESAGLAASAVSQLASKQAALAAVERGAWSPGVQNIIDQEVQIKAPAISISTPKMNWGNFSSGAGGAANSQKDVNEALTEFLALLEHRKSMDEFVENEDEYVKALIYAYQNLTKTEDERRDLAEKIYSAKKSQLENEKSALEGAAQAAMRKYDDEIDGINEVIDELDEKIKLHEKEKSNLESAHNAVIRLLDKEIEKLRTKYDEEKKQIEDKKSKYEQAHSAVMDAIDAEIKKYEDQKRN